MHGINDGINDGIIEEQPSTRLSPGARSLTGCNSRGSGLGAAVVGALGPRHVVRSCMCCCVIEEVHWENGKVLTRLEQSCRSLLVY